MDCKVLLIQSNETDLQSFLEKNGCAVTVCKNGTDALNAFRASNPDITVLDTELPDKDGLQICRELRGISERPVVIISEKTDVFDKVLALELGADDCMESPADPRELFARIRAILRRCAFNLSQNSDETVKLDRLEISLQKYILKLDGKPVRMPPKELELLYFLASNCNRVFTRDQLLDKVWGFDYLGDSRTVDVHIKRIREKINGVSPHWELTTVWGVGYKFTFNE